MGPSLYKTRSIFCTYTLCSCGYLHAACGLSFFNGFVISISLPVNVCSCVFVSTLFYHLGVGTSLESITFNLIFPFISLSLTLKKN